MEPTNDVTAVSLLTGFLQVNKSKIRGRFKDFQGHVSGNSRTNMNKIVKYCSNCSLNELETHYLSHEPPQGNAHKLKQEEFKKAFEDFLICSRTFKPFNFCFQIQGHLRSFKFCGVCVGGGGGEKLHVGKNSW